MKAVKCHKKHMIDLLRDRCSALMAEWLLQQEKRAEHSFTSALNAEASKNVHDMAAHEGMDLHDTVSYKGDCYVMDCAESDCDWPPSRVFLRSPVSPMSGGLLGQLFVPSPLTGSCCCFPDHIQLWIR